MRTPGRCWCGGSIGYVCELGVFLQDQIIYTVHFLDNGGRMVGCRKRIDPGGCTVDLTALSVVTGSPRGCHRRLEHNGGDRGTVGEVMAVIREPDIAAHCHVLFTTQVLDVPESALEASPVPENHGLIQSQPPML